MENKNTDGNTTEQILPIPEVVPSSSIQADIIASTAATNAAIGSAFRARNKASVNLDTLELPELDDEYFHIDSSNPKERTLMTDNNWITFKINEEGDVREFVSWVYEHIDWQEPKYVETDLAWQQLFTKDEINEETWELIKQWSATRETQKHKRTLAPSDESFYNIIQYKYDWEYTKFVASENIKFPWVRGPNTAKFTMIGWGFKIICADWSVFEGYRKRPDFEATENRRKIKSPWNTGDKKDIRWDSLNKYWCSVLCVKAKE